MWAKPSTIYFYSPPLPLVSSYAENCASNHRNLLSYFGILFGFATRCQILLYKNSGFDEDAKQCGGMGTQLKGNVEIIGPNTWVYIEILFYFNSFMCNAINL